MTAEPPSPYPERMFKDDLRRATRFHSEEKQFGGALRWKMGQQVAQVLHRWLAEPAARAGIRPYRIDLDNEKHYFAKLQQVVAASHYLYAPFELDPTDYHNAPPEELHKWNERRMDAFSLSLLSKKGLKPTERSRFKEERLNIRRISKIPQYARGAVYSVNKLDTWMRNAIDERLKADRIMQQKGSQTKTQADTAYENLGTHLEMEAAIDGLIRNFKFPVFRLMHAAMNYVDLQNAVHAAWPEKRYLALAALHYHAPFLFQSGLEQEAYRLQDLALSHLQPNEATEIQQVMTALAPEIEAKQTTWEAAINEELEKNGIEADVTFRPKSIFSIWEKLQRKGRDYDDPKEVQQLLGDLFAGRVVLKRVCEPSQFAGKKGALKVVWRAASPSDCYRFHNELLPSILRSLKRNNMEDTRTRIDPRQFEDYIKYGKQPGVPAESKEPLSVAGKTMALGGIAVKPPKPYSALHDVIRFGGTTKPVRNETPSRGVLMRIYDYLFHLAVRQQPKTELPVHVPGLESLQLGQMELQVLTEDMSKDIEAGPLARLIYKQLEPEPIAKPIEELFHGVTYDPNEVRVEIRLPGQEARLYDVPQDSTFLNVLMHDPQARQMVFQNHLKLSGFDHNGQFKTFAYNHRLSLPSELKPMGTEKPWYVVNVAPNLKKPTKKSDILLWLNWVDSRFQPHMVDAIRAIST